MFEHLFKRHLRIQKLRGGPRSSLIEKFAEELSKNGYADETTRQNIRAAEHLVDWMDQEGMQISELTENVLNNHFARCQCPGYVHSYGLVRGAQLFLEFLRGNGVLTTSVESMIEEPVLLVEFRHWMRQQRGCCDATFDRYALHIQELFKSLGEDTGMYDAKSLRQFVLDMSQKSGRSRVKMCTSALRMFLRFLISEGKCADTLDAAIPTVAHWRLSSLPRYLQPEEVERVIASCDPCTLSGKRDRAILLLLARLGLRAGDIVQLRMGDINWKEAEILVSGKGRCQTRLPLSQEVGDAIVDYLQTGRPQSDSDVLFIRTYAPFRTFGSSKTVSAIVTSALRRAGVTCPSRGAAHLLRHSVATAMLRHGASLMDIATILRHRSIETTQIYAKVDVAALQKIAQSWPEVQPC
jgi:site-specific recombinase XerD